MVLLLQFDVFKIRVTSLRHRMNKIIVAVSFTDIHVSLV